MHFSSFFQINVQLLSTFLSIYSFFIHISSFYCHFIYTHCFSWFCFIKRYGVRYRLDKNFFNMLNKFFIKFPKKILFTDDLNLHKILFLRSNQSEIDLHNFIIVTLCFFEVYGASCKLDTKSPGKINWFFFICSHNYFYS